MTNEPQQQILYIEIIDSCERELNELQRKLSFISKSSRPLADSNTKNIEQEKTLLESRLLQLLGLINEIKDYVRI